MGCASKQNQHGFTLVEISIVMIIIGLLIGGTFGGLRLIENMKINKTVQDLKAIESAALTFKDTYGRLPGDMPNTAARLPNCTVAPCATGGDGNRIINSVSWDETINSTSEKFTFWSHISASGLSSLNAKNTNSMNYGEGQPKSSLGNGFRITTHNGSLMGAGSGVFSGVITMVGVDPELLVTVPYPRFIPCHFIAQIDKKIDDHKPFLGNLQARVCAPPLPSLEAAEYGAGAWGARSFFYYDFKGF